MELYMVSRLSNEAVEFIIYVIIQVYAKVSTYLITWLLYFCVDKQ